MVDIARDRGKTLKKRERKTRNEKQSNNGNKFFFLLLLFLRMNLYFVKNIFGKTYFLLLHLYWNCF